MDIGTKLYLMYKIRKGILTFHICSALSVVEAKNMIVTIHNDFADYDGILELNRDLLQFILAMKYDIDSIKVDDLLSIYSDFISNGKKRIFT